MASQSEEATAVSESDLEARQESEVECASDDNEDVSSVDDDEIATNEDLFKFTKDCLRSGVSSFKELAQHIAVVAAETNEYDCVDAYRVLIGEKGLCSFASAEGIADFEATIDQIHIQLFDKFR